MTEPELKPCPFCGSKNILFREQVGAYEIYCQDCDANVGIHKTFEEAAAAWDRRDKPVSVRQEILKAKKTMCLKIIAAEQEYIDTLRSFNVSLEIIHSCFESVKSMQRIIDGIEMEEANDIFD